MRIAVAAAAAAVLVVIGATGCSAKTKPPAIQNFVNEKLMKLSPPERAAELAGKVGQWCIGTNAFLMGVAASGPRAGAAYWSLRCADGRGFAIEIDVDGIGTVVDCPSFDANGFGKRCFKKF